jgi:cyclohexyl-isocyanide hydratase
MTTPLNVGIYVFENMTMLDGYAPLQILSLVEQFNCFTFARSTDPVRCDSGVMLMPQYSLDDCPNLDILIMPGGGDVLPPMVDADLMTFLRGPASQARYITSVCSGALILAEAGLLDGFKATTHWAWVGDLKTHFPAVEVTDGRVVVDRNRITGGGITAGIDFALTLIAEVLDPIQAQAIQLLVEYRPQPPFDAGSPTTAPPPIVDAVTQQIDVVMTPLRAHLAGKTKAAATSA